MEWRWTGRDFGSPIVVYRGYGRLRLGLGAALSGIGAVIAGWGASGLDGTLWVIPVAIAALAMSALALKLAGRFLAPGKLVGVYENALVLGWRVAPWDGVDRIEYRDVSVRERHSNAEHREVTFTFFLRREGEMELHLSNATLPFHVDVPEFITALRERGVPVIDELAPIEHREEVHASVSERNPDLSAELQAEFRGALSEAGDVQSVVTSLGRGERERRQYRRRYFRRYVVRKSAEILLWGCVVALVLLAIPLGILGLIEVAHLFNHDTGSGDPLGSLGLPPGPYRLLLVVIGLVVDVQILKRVSRVADSAGAIARRLRSQFRAIRRPRPVTVGDFSNPFALYLRSFAGEFFRYLETTEEKGSDGLSKRYETLERELDRRVIEAVEDRMPLFALANARDPSASPDLRALFVPTEDWVGVVAFLIRNSSSVILHLSAVTESVMAELWALDHLGAHDETFVVIGDDFREDALDEEERNRLRRFLHRVQDGPEFDLVGELRKFMTDEM